MTTARWIRRLVVENLFGRYTYDLRLEPGASEKLLLLYGDNGAGKTTVLSLAFHLLNHLEKQGHKSAVGEIPFSSFSIEFNDRTVVEAQRPTNQTSGGYSILVKRRTKTIASADLLLTKGHAVEPPKEQETHFQAVLEALRSLQLTLFLVSDDRQLLSNLRKRQDSVELTDELIGLDLEKEFLRHRGRLRSREQARSIDAALERALESVVTWAQEQALSGSRQGETDTGAVYTNIVKRFLRSARAESMDQTDTAATITALQDQANRSAAFAKLGLPTAENLGELLELAKSADRNTPLLPNILDPYVESVKARLDALEDLQFSLSRFIVTVNSFYVDKEISFTLERGVRVTDTDGHEISPLALSSGEKQLLLLFANTIVATGRSTIVLIDEPELSLNTKWQRSLLDSLLESSGARNIQFVLATHSFEIIAQHTSNVAVLKHAQKRAHKASAPETFARTSGTA